MKKLKIFILCLFVISNLLAQNKLISYVYWFNNDDANKQTVSVTPNESHQLIANFDVSALPKGVNVFNIRYKDENGKFSSIVSKSFVIMDAPFSEQNQLVEYEYWFNNNEANKQTASLSPGTSHLLVYGFDVSALPNGVNVFNIRYMDVTGKFSSIINKAFVKLDAPVTGNKIIAYRYWFDDDIDNQVMINLDTPQAQTFIIKDLDMSFIPEGNYTLCVQFLDAFGKWSVVSQHDFEKESYPVAGFTSNIASTCDSSVVTFTNTSIDGDSYTWDFGDGFSSTDMEPQHTYYSSGSYDVKLTVTDTTLHISDTISNAIIVNTNSVSALTEVACNSYTAPDGMVYNTSGIKTAVITNFVGCDSVITIDLTINTVDTSISQNGAVLTANATGATYQWLDCNSEYSIIEGETNQLFTPGQNGNYAVKVSQGSCIDTSSCISVSTVGIMENTFKNHFVLYPNPTNAKITIELGETLNSFTVTVTDLSGKVIRQLEYSKTDKFDMNLDIQPGVYLLTINSDDKKATLRLIKK